MRTLRDYALWPVAGVIVFWIGFAIALHTAAPNAPYCRDTIGVIQWPAIGYMPVSLIGSALTSWKYAWSRRLLLIAWNVSVSAAALFLSYGLAFGGAGPNNCGV